MRETKKIALSIYFAFMVLVVVGGVAQFCFRRYIGNSFAKVLEENKALTARHTHEVSAKMDVIKTFTNDENVKITVDNYTETDDTIIVDITMDTTDIKFSDEKATIPEQILQQEKPLGAITVSVLTFDADFNDEEFRRNLLNECFMSNYNLGPYFQRLKYSAEQSSEYGFVINHQPIGRERNYILYNEKTNFTIVLNKNKVQMIRLTNLYNVTHSGYSCVYMLINTDY